MPKREVYWGKYRGTGIEAADSRPKLEDGSPSPLSTEKDGSFLNEGEVWPLK